MRSKEQFNNHPLWDSVSAIQDNEDLSGLPTDTRNYIKALLIELGRRRGMANPYMVPKSSLDSLNSHLQNMVRYIPNSPDNAVDYADQAFYELSRSWPGLMGSQIRDITTSTFETIMEDMTVQTKEAYDAVNRVDEAAARYEEEIARLNASIEEFKENADSKIDNVVADAEERSSELNEELNANIESNKNQAESALHKTEAEFIDKLEKIENQAQDLLDKVSNKANKISGRVIADSYGRYARNKAISKTVYDIAAVIFAITGIILVGFALVEMHADETSATVFKMAVSVASFTVSGFLFKRGTYEQREAKAAKRTELTLRQYEAFIANLDDDEKTRITTEIADRIFIKGEIDDNTLTMTEAFAQRGISDKDLKVLLDFVSTLQKSGGAS